MKKRRSDAAVFTLDNLSLSLLEWSRILGVKKHTLYTRIVVRGMPLRDALEYARPVERHGKSKTPEYHAWSNMIGRCCNRKNRAYKNYGGRGIGVCDRWKNSFANFLKDVGLRPTKRHSLERVKNEKGYEPGNVKWALPIEQSRNTRKNVVLNHGGRSMILKDWAKEKGLSNTTLWNRLFVLGWNLDRALFETPGPNGR